MKEHTNITEWLNQEDDYTKDLFDALYEAVTTDVNQIKALIENGIYTLMEDYTIAEMIAESIMDDVNIDRSIPEEIETRTSVEEYARNLPLDKYIDTSKGVLVRED